MTLRDVHRIPATPTWRGLEASLLCPRGCGKVVRSRARTPRGKGMATLRVRAGLDQHLAAHDRAYRKAHPTILERKERPLDV